MRNRFRYVRLLPKSWRHTKLPSGKDRIYICLSDYSVHVFFFLLHINEDFFMLIKKFIM